MLVDPTIKEAALTCIREHGGSAAYYAATRADEFLDAGDLDGSNYWRLVLAEVERVLGAEPTGETN